MLFRKNIVPSCAYCKHGIFIGLGEVACSRRGIMQDRGSCSAFRYEPTKRKPEYAAKPVAREYTSEEMSL